MDTPKQTPEASHVRSREEVEALNQPVDPIKELEKSMVAHLGGVEKGAKYTKYPSDQALHSTNVERKGGKIETDWFILGEAENIDGDIIHMVGKIDENGRKLAKPATPDQLVAWNTPETRAPQVIQENLGRIGLRLGGLEHKPIGSFEIVDPPVEQLTEADFK